MVPDYSGRVHYVVRKIAAALPLNSDWNAPAWQQAETLELANFRPESSAHRPAAFARLLYDAAGIHGMFFVRDRFVRCLRTNYFDEVWKDSCVEIFLQPKADKGYFNFEFNCGGAFLCCYITDPTRTKDGFKEFVRIPESLGRNVKCCSTLPRTVDPEIPEPTNWTVQFFIPFSLLENYVGKIEAIAGQRWRANFFKCADETSHPHWAAWSPVDELNFHLPRCFGSISFEA